MAEGVQKEVKTEELILESRNFFEAHKKEIGNAVRQGKTTIIVDFSELAERSPTLADYLFTNPDETIEILEVALEEMGLVKNPRVRFNELPESYSEKIRNLRAQHLNKFIQIDGIIRQASEVRPQVVNAKFECPSCGTIISILQIEAKFKEPSRCSCGRRGGFKLLSKEMVDAQRLVIEESPESLSGGEQPRRISVFLKEDLVEPKMEEKTTPGARIRAVGVLKEIVKHTQTGAVMTRYDIAIEANNLIPLEENFEDFEISEEDEKQIQELAADPEVFVKLAKSIAPSIFGYDEIKQSLVLQLFGGVKKTKSDGTSTRGDFHVLLVGDPGVAKSQTLKFISSIAPKGRYVVGKSATGAGLTATVVRDEFLKGWSLEAGAMVLSNKGVLCIDEMDKMDSEDRSAMHEALEQQTVTISKANVQATLRAETSVLAAANPKFGRFDPYQTVSSQLDLPPTLINRFDVIFILKDNPDRVKDEAIANHVLAEHSSEVKRNIIDRELFRKYIAFSKQKVKPQLTDDAINEIKKFYVDLRNMPVSGDSVTRPLPISARQLEALIRMSEASAKTRLSDKVSRDDAKRAINLMKFYLMQVGYDYETKTFDIDRIATGVSSSQRGKIILVRDSIANLESKLGKLIPIEEVKKDLQGKMEEKEVDEGIDKLTISGDIFHPRKGFVQRM
ncbi:MAG: minichromosome maintenance protein MCM [Nanoarchaeota archaeon]|nr:minichromosome maintenance protein MCM [Nanoarchaeota archaeon]